MDTERRLGFDPKDRELEKLGYDIQSRIPGWQRPAAFHRGQGAPERCRDHHRHPQRDPLFAEQAGRFILAIVEFGGDDDSHCVRYVRRPFQSEPDFGAASVNYAMKDLLAKSEAPR